MFARFCKVTNSNLFNTDFRISIPEVILDIGMVHNYWMLKGPANIPKYQQFPSHLKFHEVFNTYKFSKSRCWIFCSLLHNVFLSLLLLCLFYLAEKHGSIKFLTSIRYMSLLQTLSTC